MTRSTLMLFVLVLAASAVSLMVGAADVVFEHVFSADPAALEVLFVSRLPRLLALLLTGAGMSIAGLIMQQLCANKFVSPTTGATISCAQFGILIALLVLPDGGLLGRAFFAFLSAVFGTWVFVWFVMRLQVRDVVMVPLVGIMFGNVVGGITSFLAFKYEMTQAMSTWLVGHFSLVMKGNYELVWLAAPLIVLAYAYAKHFNIAGMGKDFSSNLGVSYNVVLFGGLSIAAMITASVVSVVGAVSYIGLIIPNTVSLFKGDDLKATLPDTALFGAFFVVVCDVIGRLVIHPYELPIELIVGTLGSFCFIALIFWRLKFGRNAVTKDKLLAFFGFPSQSCSCGVMR